MLAQLAWTLRQEPAIRSVPGVDRRPAASGGRAAQRVRGRRRARRTTRPVPRPAPPLRPARRVAGVRAPDALEAVDGPLGTAAFGVRSVGVNLDATQVAGSPTGDGTSVVVGPVEVAAPAGVTEVVSGAATCSARPGTSPTGCGWSTGAPRAPASACRARPSGAGRRARRDRARRSGLPGSRDGSRLVAVVPAPGGDHLMVSRVLHDDQGAVLRASPGPADLVGGGGRLAIRDIAWHAPPPWPSSMPDRRARPRCARSPSTGRRPGWTACRRRCAVGWALVGSPVGDEPVYAVTRRSLIDLSDSERGDATRDPRVTLLTYVG